MTGVLRLAMPSILCLTAATVASSQDGQFQTELSTGHFVIGIENGRLTGPGASACRVGETLGHHALSWLVEAGLRSLWFEEPVAWGASLPQPRVL